MRRAHEHLFDANYETVLRAAEGADLLKRLQSSPGSKGAGPGAMEQLLLPQTTLLRRPKVFTLAVVWESPQVCTAVMACA